MRTKEIADTVAENYPEVALLCHIVSTTLLTKLKELDARNVNRQNFGDLLVFLAEWMDKELERDKHRYAPVMRELGKVIREKADSWGDVKIRLVRDEGTDQTGPGKALTMVPSWDKDRIKILEAQLRGWQKWAGHYCGAPTSDKKVRADIDIYIEELKTKKENTP